MTANTAVTSATRRLNVFSACSFSSCGFGSSTSAKGGRRLSHLFTHGLAACLEGAHESLRLLLEDLAALVEPLAGSALRVHRELLRAPRQLVAAVAQKAAALFSRTRRQQQRRKPAERR